MTDARDALEAYADEEQDFGREWGISSREEIAHLTFDALRATLDDLDRIDSHLSSEGPIPAEYVTWQVRETIRKALTDD